MYFDKFLELLLMQNNIIKNGQNQYQHLFHQLESVARIFIFLFFLCFFKCSIWFNYKLLSSSYCFFLLISNFNSD